MKSQTPVQSTYESVGALADAADPEGVWYVGFCRGVQGDLRWHQLLKPCLGSSEEQKENPVPVSREQKSPQPNHNPKSISLYFLT